MPLFQLGWTAAVGLGSAVSYGAVGNLSSQFENVPQILGHTYHRTPQWKANTVCLDTGLFYYGLLEGPKLTIIARRDKTSSYAMVPEEIMES